MPGAEAAGGCSPGPTRTRRLIRATERSAMETTASRYPLRLTGELSPRLSRGLWLVKWLLAIPHFIVLFFFAGVVLLFTGRYPQALYDFVLGMSRWVFRVAAYAALMTDTYPPFRLDMGGNEPPTATASDTVPPMPAPVTS